MLKYLGFGLTVAGGLALMLLRPAAALSASAQLLLGGVVIVLGLWIFRPFSLPLSVGGFALAGFALAGLAKGAGTVAHGENIKALLAERIAEAADGRAVLRL